MSTMEQGFSPLFSPPPPEWFDLSPRGASDRLDASGAETFRRLPVDC